jgi:hypothetical protein
MAQKINIGNTSNDGTGDSIREAFKKVNANFEEIYGINNLGQGLFFTKLRDTPRTLVASTANWPTLIVVDNIGGISGTLTQKRLVAGEGISLSTTVSNYITITAPNTSLKNDPNPFLAGNLNAQNYKIINLGLPDNDQDAATKSYVDGNTFYSNVNFYVSTKGSDTFPVTVPYEKQGRSLAYAYRTVNRACVEAEKVISTSTVRLGPYEQYITLGNQGSTATTATVFATIASPEIEGDTRLFISYGDYSGTDPYLTQQIRSGQYIQGADTGAIAFIDNLGQTTYLGTPVEYYDIQIRNGSFRVGESLKYTDQVPAKNITVFVESGTYEEQLPIRVPPNVSIRGDEFRRTIIRPAVGTSNSKWANLKFRRDQTFDGLTKTDLGGQGLAAPGIYSNKFGYHYLTDPTDKTSTPKLNEDMDVFLMNDAGILRAISSQGHGGFMCVLDPEGQILTKSPYMQNNTSFSRSINRQIFAGGVFVDGFAGNQLVVPDDTITYFLGTTTVVVTNLVRSPQTPFAIYNQGNRYLVDYVSNYTTSTGVAKLHLNLQAEGGIAFTDGIITVSDGAGYEYSPTVIFSQPAVAGGVSAQGIAHLVGSSVAYVEITNPGSGYSGSATVSFVGGNPLIPAETITITSSNIKIGWVGIFPATIELGTAGNKSMLNADFTQMNDGGYGIVGTNNAFIENVSVFTYYNNVGYYAINGAQLRSLNGACGYGNYALKAEGSDPNEVPTPVVLTHDMIQTGTVVNLIVGQTNTINTSGSTAIYIQGYQYLPFNQSKIDIDHGDLVDTNGTILGIRSYDVASVSTVTDAVAIAAYPGLARLELAGGSILGLSTGGLKASVKTGTPVTIRANNVLQFQGVNQQAFVRPSTVLQYTDIPGITYHVLSYDYSGLPEGYSNIAIRESFSSGGYIELKTYSGFKPQPGATSIVVNDLSTATNRILSNIGSTSTQLTFGWNGRMHRITNITTTSNRSSATITIVPGLSSTVTNASNTATTTLYAGLRAYSKAEITARISTLRVSGHDLYNIGAGTFEQSNVPNDIYGPAKGIISASKERVEVGKGRVFAVTTDQNGNFKVGSLFQVNQDSGELTISGNLSLTSLEGLGFAKGGATIHKFSTDDTMVNAADDSVPTEQAIVSYINHRLGLTAGGDSASKIGSGYLDLTGQQSMAGSIKMAGNNINMGSAAIINLTASSSTAALSVVNKQYVDIADNTKVAIGGTTSVDPISGTSTSYLGVMTGPLILSGDPDWFDNGSRGATKRYVDKFARQLSTMNDVRLGVQTTTRGVVNTPQDQHFLMFSTVTVTVSTGTATSIWTATRQIINVGLSTSSHVWFSRLGNTLTMTINTGSIINSMVSDTAQIQQSKLSMNAAVAGTTSTGLTQDNLGLTQFDQSYFKVTNGWATLCNPNNFPITVNAANHTTSTLGFNSIYVNAGAFNGTTTTNWTLNASATGGNDKIVVTNGSGGFSIGGTICANIVQSPTFLGDLYASDGTSKILCNGTGGTSAWFCGNVCGTINGTSGRVEYALSTGTDSYIIGESFDGSVARTWCINASSACKAGALVARDSTGNFNANMITGSCICATSHIMATTFCGNLCGTVNGNSGAAQCIDGFGNPCTLAAACTIAYRDATANITACCFIANGCFSGLAMCAKYADLAENYSADRCYPPCTVLQFGGPCEVTIAQDGTRAVAGVVSTKPAYLMNGELDAEFVTALALQGRVPVKVRGKIRKGDMMVSAGDGYARPEYNPTMGTVIGKALEDFDGVEGVIEIVVGRL